MVKSRGEEKKATKSEADKEFLAQKEAFELEWFYNEDEYAEELEDPDLPLFLAEADRVFEKYKQDQWCPVKIIPVAIPDPSPF
jgi:hypothetical protein